MDLMAGTGETWPYLLRRRPDIRFITAVDISSEMNIRALDILHRKRATKIMVKEANLLQSDLVSESADFVISAFGLKTFSQDQQAIFAKEVARILRHGGVFSFVEASDPKGWILRPLYLFYLNRILPLIEKFFLNGAQDFSMLGTYARNFQDCSHFAKCLKEQGLELDYKRYFFGCATGVVGRKS
jgi:demethylmenaquinone methyltransferase/2-methoxy-6-polyprenyl-1,4-benzoquinol methylase